MIRLSALTQWHWGNEGCCDGLFFPTLCQPMHIPSIICVQEGSCHGANSSGQWHSPRILQHTDRPFQKPLFHIWRKCLRTNRNPPSWHGASWVQHRTKVSPLIPYLEPLPQDETSLRTLQKFKLCTCTTAILIQYTNFFDLFILSE